MKRSDRRASSSMALLFAAAAAAAGAAGCGGAGSGERHFQLRAGETWVYRVTDDNSGQHEKRNIVEAEEDVGGRWAGTTAWRVRMETLDGVNMSWQQDTGTAVRRLRDKTFDAGGVLLEDQFYDPYKLRLDEAHLEPGDTWTERYTEVLTNIKKNETKTTERADQWTVLSLSDKVTVPAGTFECLQVYRVSLETSSTKMYWFARGVGKVKESAKGQKEELAAHTLP